MAKITIDSLITAWTNLVTNGRSSGAEVPGLSPHIDTLEKVLAGVRDLTTLLDSRKALKQRATQERRELLKQGKDVAHQALSALTAHYGIRNEQLVEYGGSPLRSRKASPKKNKNKEPKPQPAAPAPPPKAE
jgi:hypothetical protein